MSLATLSPAEHDERVVSLAALLLFDAGAEITADKLSEVIAASGNTVEKYWLGMFAALLAKSDVKAILASTTSPGSGGGGGGGGAAPAPAAGGGKKDDKKDEKKEKKEEKPKEEEVNVAAGDLFGGGGGGKY